LSSRRPTRKGKVKTKVVDKWKEKSWFEVIAPNYIVEKSLGETPASDPEKLYGRVIEMAKLGVADDQGTGKIDVVVSQFESLPQVGVRGPHLSWNVEACLGMRIDVMFHL